MSRIIVKLEGRYFEYSSIVDAPVTEPMTLEELQEFIKDEYGSRGLEDLPARLESVERNGTSNRRTESAEEAIILNRFGKGETELSLEQFKAWARGELDPRVTVGDVKREHDS